MGVRMLRDQLGLLGLHVGRRHVRTLMRRMDIQTIAPHRPHSKLDKLTPNNAYLDKMPKQPEPVKAELKIAA